MNKTIIIAEAGVNHNGKLSIAKLLANKAKEAGADYVKFQIYDVNEICTVNSQKADYQKKYGGKNETQYQLLKKLQLSEKEFIHLYNYCKKIKIKFLLSCFNVSSLEIFKKIKVDFIKIPSGEINNQYLINEICKLKKPIILSSGMTNYNELKKIVFKLKKKISLKKISLLHCNSAYPTPDRDANLNVIKSFAKKFNCKIGYSDHTEGFEASLSAVSLGAKIIEKHFTLNKNMDGPDHKSSLDPNEFKNLVKSIRKVENLLGSEKKFITKSESSNRRLVRKSIVARKFIEKGDKFSFENLALKRPGTGLEPKMLNKLINKIAKKNFKKDQQIKT